MLRQAKGDLAGAEALYEKALATRRTLGDDHRHTDIRKQPRLLRRAKGDLAGAEALSRRLWRVSAHAGRRSS